MRPLQLVMTAALGLLAANTASGALGVTIPVSVSSATVHIEAGSDSTEVTDSLPLSVPFSFSDGGCISSGTVTLSLVSGKVQVHNQGSISGVGCLTHIVALNLEVSFEVPDLGENVTHVLLTHSIVSSSLSAIDALEVFGEFGSPYLSTLTAGTVTIQDNVLDCWLVDRASSLIPLISGDVVTFDRGRSFASYLATASSGTFDETYELSASLPPEPVTAAVPTGLGWLLGGVLLGLGMKFARRGMPA